MKKLAESGERLGDPDRVWLTFERKYRVVQYESLSVSLGAQTAAEPGETLSEATKRLFADLRADFTDVLEVMRDQEGI